MKLYLQFGHGMMGHCRTLVREWGGGTTILSPRDLTRAQLERLGSDLSDLGGSLLLDPQFYLPRADHHRLTSHDYWPDGYDTSDFPGRREPMMRSLAHLNRCLGTSALIVPGEMAQTVDELWIASQQGMLEAARATTSQRLIVTICLSSDAVRSAEQIALVVGLVEDSREFGCYLVLQRPHGEYFVEDPSWLANALDLCASLRRLGAEVVVGYSNHQHLIMACAAATGIASGTWANVRCFWPGKFRAAYEEEIRRRATWYYCPQALSEYKLQYLDFAVQRGLGDALRPDPSTPYADPLFAAAVPTASGWSELDAFRHYLTALQAQTASATCPTFDETVIAHRRLLDRAEATLSQFRARGVLGQNRDFRDALDANRAALTDLEATHGPLLRRQWGALTQT